MDRAPTPPVPEDRLFLRTKLSRPAARADLVARPRLLDLLDGCAQRRLTLVSAPPGFGKTTLAAQWLESRPRLAAWLSLDPRDEDPERFASYLVAVLQATVPESLPNAGALVGARQAPPWSYFAEVLASDASRISEPVLLVLDDAHGIGTGVSQELLARLIEAAPEQLRILALTRVDPPWPLGTWRARGWLGEVRARDLRFQVEEARSFFGHGTGPALTGPAVEMLVEKTEGWPAGLCLVRLSLAGEAKPEERVRAFSGQDRLVVDYLMPEVLSSQPPEVREFLAVTAPLERFCAPLCDHLLAGVPGRAPARETLARLESRNLFLVPLDAERRWYRYHHLFQDLLLHQLEELAEPGARTRIARRAGEWFAREGHLEEALRYWVEAGELDLAADLLWENLDALVSEDASRRLVARRLAIFPAGAERGRLPLLVARLVFEITRWDLALMGRLLDEAERLLEAEEPVRERYERLRRDLDGHRACQLYWTGDFEGALRHGARALAKEIEGKTTHMLVYAVFYTAAALARLGRLSEGLRVLDDAVSGEQAAGRGAAGEFLYASSALLLYATELDWAREKAGRVFSLHETIPVPLYWRSHANHVLGVVAYERNELDEAEARFRDVESEKYQAPSRVYHDALVGLALVARARGDLTGLESRVGAARAFALESGDSSSRQVGESLEIRLAFLAGRRPPADPGLVSDADRASFFLEVPSITWAESRLHDSRPGAAEEALASIDRQLEGVEAFHNERQAIVLRLLRARALAAVGRLEDALEVLAGVLRRAEPHRLVRSFLDRGPGLRHLLEKLVARDGRSEYVGFLLDAFRLERTAAAGFPLAGGPRPSSEEVKPPEPWRILSRRELEVLELLEKNLTNKEIAARTKLTSDGVKKRIAATFRKLEVHDRREAVAVARDRGILRRPS